MDLIKFQNFRASKDSIIKMKRQTRDKDKVFANHVSDKRCVFGIYKQRLHIQNKKTAQLNIIKIFE